MDEEEDRRLMGFDHRGKSDPDEELQRCEGCGRLGRFLLKYRKEREYDGSACWTYFRPRVYLYLCNRCDIRNYMREDDEYHRIPADERQRPNHVDWRTRVVTLPTAKRQIAESEGGILTGLEEKRSRGEGADVRDLFDVMRRINYGWCAVPVDGGCDGRPAESVDAMEEMEHLDAEFEQVKAVQSVPLPEDYNQYFSIVGVPQSER